MKSGANILVVASTFPANDKDPVPAFVKDQVINLKTLYPDVNLSVLAPYDNSSKSRLFTRHRHYDEYRFQYVWPKSFSKLAGRGIVPSIKKNKLLYLLVPQFIFFEFKHLLKITRKLEPSAIYAHWFTPQAVSGALVAKLTDTPLVFTTHSSDMVVLSSVPLHKKLIKFVMKYVYRWTAVSESTLKNTRKVFPADMREQYESKSKVIPMGVNVQDIAKYNLDKVSEELTALKGRDLILFIGRLAEIKGTDILIKSFSRIKFSKAVLVIAGDGPDKSKLVGLAKDLGISDRVYFTGYVHVDEKKYLLSIARLLVISSVKDSNGHTEGMPVVLMEGLAAGKIIVASNQSRAETIIENEVSGFIYDSRDVRMLSTTIDKVLSMDKKEYNAVQGQAKELSLQFDWSTVAKQHYEFLFKDLLE